ncbi:hypothetical protein ScPMuIL_016609 [Solemya velum]
MTNLSQKKKKNVSNYEEQRHKNIEDNQVMLKRLMSELKDYSTPIKAPPKKPRQQKSKDQAPSRRNPSRASRFTPYSTSPPRTRARRGSLSTEVSEASSSPATSPNRLVIRFGFNRKQKTTDSDTDSADQGEDGEPLTLPSRVHRIVREAKSADEITQEDLDMVATSTSDKKYDSFYGNTCHQCRQKTDDMKTVCRSGDCFGVRGQFCGPCLRNRYGEDAKEALKNPDWVCPPCRGICNCSFCRKRSGKNCTGILIHMAREKGFSNVSDYLIGLKK